MRARLTLLVPRVGFGALVVACVVVPTIFSRQAAEAFMVPKVTVLWVSLIVATAGLVGWAVAARRSPLPRLAIRWPLLLLVGWTVLASAFSVAPWLSILGHYGRYDGLLGTVSGAAAALLVVGYTWRAPDRLRVVALALIASAVVGLGYIVIQQLGLDWVEWLNESLKPIERPYGLLGNSNFSGAHLALCIPLALAFADRAASLVARLAWWGLAGAFGLGIWLTGTRGGMLAAVGGVAVAGLIAPQLVPKVVRWGAVALTIVGMVVVLAASTGDTVRTRQEVTGPRVLQRDSLADRREIWAAGWKMTTAHPLVGVGPDAFGLVFVDYRPTPAPSEPPLNADEAHDIYIDRAATAGLPALGAYLWLLVVVGIGAWRGRTRLADEHRWLLGGFAGTLGAYLLQGTFSIDVVPLALLGWVALGAVASLTDPDALDQRDDPDRAPVALRPLPLGAFAGLVAATVLLVALALRPLMGDLRFRDGLEAVSQDRPGAEAAADFTAAASWLDSEPRYHARAADQLVLIASSEATDDELKVRLLTEAIDGYDAALDRAPGDLYVLRSQARVHGLLADLDPANRDAHQRDAIERYRGLVRRSPTDVSLRTEYALALETFANDTDGGASRRLTALATEQFQTILDQAPDQTAALSGLARIAIADGRLVQARRLLKQASDIKPGDEGIRSALEQVEADLQTAPG